MKIFNRISRPLHLLAGVVRKLCFLFPNDKIYLKIIYRLEMGHKLNLDKPHCFTEKIQWLKLYDRKPEYTKMVDKIAAKEYVADIIGNEYIIPTLGVWESFDDIDFSQLPNQFVLKCNQGGGGSGIIICRDKSKLDKEKAKKELERSMCANCYPKYREWPYKNIVPKIFAEQLLTEYGNPLKDQDPSDIFDYKFFCFNGKVEFFKIDFGRFIEHHANYYTANAELLNFYEIDFPADSNANIEIPNNLNEMIRIAESLSNNHLFLRVDLYNCKGKIYFGELTFYPASGFGKFSPTGSDEMIGDLLKL